MKLEQFNKLCDMQWSQEIHGDVIKLELTNAGLVELTEDCLASGASFTELDEIQQVAVGASVAELINPVTRTSVKVVGDRTRTKITVSYGSVFA